MLTVEGLWFIKDFDIRKTKDQSGFEHKPIKIDFLGFCDDCVVGDSDDTC